MGSVRGGGGSYGRRDNTTAYFVALAAILVLLAALCCYFFYFCLSKVKELTREDSPLNQPCTNTAAQQRTSYPVQQGVRDSATVMARLCRQLPTAAERSPEAGDCSAADSADPATDTTTDGSVSAAQDKLPSRRAVCGTTVAAAS